jgi:hypothetical protein
VAVTDPNYQGFTAGTLIVGKGQATVSFDPASLNQNYDGSQKRVSPRTNPANLSISLTYTLNGVSVSAPTSPGSYAVAATITSPDYQGTAASTLVINKGVPTITWPNPPSIAYGTPLDATQLNAKAGFNGSPVSGTFSYSSAAGTVLAAGSQTLSVTFTPSDTKDLMNVTNSITLQVSKATPVVAWTNPAAITYGMPLNASQLNASTSLQGLFSYSPPIGAFLTAGVQNLSSTFIPADPADYNTVTSTVQITVLPAPLSVISNSASRFYGSPNPQFTGTVSGVVSPDNITATFTTSAAQSSQPGSYPIKAVIYDPNHRMANYLLTEVDGMLTINPAPIIMLSSTSFDFGTQSVFTTSTSVTLVVQNVGTADLTMTPVSLAGANAGDFTLGNSCNSAVARGTTCNITLAFTPTGLRSRTATLTVTDNTGGQAGSLQTVALSGTGALPNASTPASTPCGSAAVTPPKNASTNSHQLDREKVAKSASCF